MGTTKKKTGEHAMGQRENVPLTEPEIVPCLFVTGAAVDTTAGCIRLIAWNHVPSLGGEMEERRIVTRVAMSEAIAHALYDQLHKLFFANVH